VVRVGCIWNWMRIMFSGGLCCWRYWKDLYYCYFGAGDTGCISKAVVALCPIRRRWIYERCRMRSQGRACIVCHQKIFSFRKLRHCHVFTLQLFLPSHPCVKLWVSGQPNLWRCRLRSVLNECRCITKQTDIYLR